MNMADDKMARAQKTYETLCAALDAQNWKYKRDDEHLRIESGAQGDDLPMDFFITVDADRQILRLISRLPFVISEDKRLDLAIAANAVNNCLVDGSFDFDLSTGRVYFRLTSSFIESDIGQDLIIYMLMVACHTIDEYNDKFLMLGKGMMKIEDFLPKE